MCPSVHGRTALNTANAERNLYLRCFLIVIRQCESSGWNSSSVRHGLFPPQLLIHIHVAERVCYNCFITPLLFLQTPYSPSTRLHSFLPAVVSNLESEDHKLGGTAVI
jgi:hypothetical protein